MKCSRAEYLISALINGDIGADEEKSLREHIDECLQCRNIYETQLAVEGELKGLETPVPDTGFAKRTARLAAEIPLRTPPLRARNVISWMRTESVIGICIALMVGLTWAIMGGGFTRLIERGLVKIVEIDMTSQGWLITVAGISLIVLALVTLGIRRVARNI